MAFFAVNSFGITCSIVFPWKCGPKVFFTYSVVVLYFLPLAVATTYYTLIWLHLRKIPGMIWEASSQQVRAHRMNRNIRIMVLVVVMFALGWLCEHLFILLLVWDPGTNFWTDSYRIGSATAKLLLYLNSALNPFVHSLAGTGFKKHLPSWPCKHPGQQSGTGTNTAARAGQYNLHEHQAVHGDTLNGTPPRVHITQRYYMDEPSANAKGENTWL